MTRDFFDLFVKRLIRFYPNQWNAARAEQLWVDIKDMPNEWFSSRVNAMCSIHDPNYPLVEMAQRYRLNKAMENKEPVIHAPEALEQELQLRGARSLIEAVEIERERLKEVPHE